MVTLVKQIESMIIGCDHASQAMAMKWSAWWLECEQVAGSGANSTGPMYQLRRSLGKISFAMRICDDANLVCQVDGTAKCTAVTVAPNRVDRQASR